MTTTEYRTPAGNSTYKKLAVQWLNEHLFFVSSAVLAVAVLCSEIANFLNNCKTLQE
jgi:hypothetical protein